MELYKKIHPVAFLAIFYTIPLSYCIAQISNKIPVRSVINRIPVPGIWGAPICEAFVMFRCEDHISEKNNKTKL